jgi:S-adenosylmethionine:tRNA ribosyltransferase-isomerase
MYIHHVSGNTSPPGPPRTHHPVPRAHEPVPQPAPPFVPTGAEPEAARPLKGLPTSSYDYGLPEEAVAQAPAEPRSAARLLVGARLTADGGVTHSTMADLPVLLGPGDVLVVNETSVLAARLHLRKETGGQVEVLLLEPDAASESWWEALVRPGRRLRRGTLLFEDDRREPVVEVGPTLTDGRRLVRLLDPSVIERAGALPLPPYFHGRLEDPNRYQTVYAAPREPGARSSAAPTAGLHFTPELLDSCRKAGAEVLRVDLAIGIGTFRPITAASVEGHLMHSERYSVPEETLAACLAAERVVAVGTTSVRALEAAAASGVLAGRTDLYIRGEYPFRLVDVLITNFHMPRSSLLVLVDAFAGPVWRDLYTTALADGYRFLSFGDAMIVRRRRGSSEPSKVGEVSG